MIRSSRKTASPPCSRVTPGRRNGKSRVGGGQLLRRSRRLRSASRRIGYQGRSGALSRNSMSGRTRWPNRDPVAEAGDINIYSYVTNAPQSFIDYLGLSPDPCCPDGHPIDCGRLIRFIFNERQRTRAMVDNYNDIRNNMTHSWNTAVAYNAAVTAVSVAIPGTKIVRGLSHVANAVRISLLGRSVVYSYSYIMVPSAREIARREIEAAALKHLYRKGITSIAEGVVQEAAIVGAGWVAHKSGINDLEDVADYGASTERELAHHSSSLHERHKDMVSALRVWLSIYRRCCER